jgi:hypothetical protein
MVSQLVLVQFSWNILLSLIPVNDYKSDDDDDDDDNNNNNNKVTTV